MMQQRDSRQNIRVAVRCRPLNTTEIRKGSLSCVECCRDKIIIHERSSNKTYSFDEVFGPYSKQIEIYKSMVSPLIDEILCGYNCTLFAYGQTGSGKTYTMTGERTDKLRYAWDTDPLAGIIPRALSQLFETLENNGSDFSVRVSFLEVYNEELFDLLSASELNRLAIYDDINRKGSVVVKGLREVVVLDKDSVYSVIERGLARRQTATTLLNAQSSRSHSIFTVTIHVKEMSPATGEELLRIGKLHLVDLAGSESVSKSGAIDKRLREAGSINQSLLTLGRVITSLVEHAPHIPYRESKLTRLLQDSLGGKTKTSIIATISPHASSVEETSSTLDYAHRAKNIQNRPEVNAILNKVDLVRSYNEELERLRRDLEAARTKTGIFIDEENFHAMQSQISQQRIRICDLEERREILEHDLKEIQDVFSLNQSELEQVRMQKDEIETDLLECQRNLECMRAKMLKVKSKLEEEQHISSEYQKLEKVLRREAQSLQTTADTAVDDVGGLHAKVDRLNTLDQDVRTRMERIPSAWVPTTLESPLKKLDDVGIRWNAYYQRIRNTLSDLRTKQADDNAQFTIEHDALQKKLATCLASECIDSAKRTDQFATEQAALARRCIDESLLLHFQKLEVCRKEMQDQLSHLKEHMYLQQTAFTSLHEQFEGLLCGMREMASQCSDFVVSEREHRVQREKMLNEYQGKKDAAIQKLSEALSDVNKNWNEVHNLCLADCNSTQTRLDNWNTSHTGRIESLSALITKTESDLSSTNKCFHTSTSAYLHDLSGNVKQLSGFHFTLKEQAGDSLEQMHRAAVSFSETGLGAELRKRAQYWTEPPNLEDGTPDILDLDHCSVQLNELARVSRDYSLKCLHETSGCASEMENMSSDMAVEVDVALNSVKSDLSELPAGLQEYMKCNLVEYVPTGETPQRRAFAYPRQLPSPLSNRKMVEKFRQLQRARGLEELALTPLPDVQDDTEATDEPLNVTSDDGVDKENRVSSSGLGSVSSAAELFSEYPGSPKTPMNMPLHNMEQPKCNVSKAVESCPSPSDTDNIHLSPPVPDKPKRGKNRNRKKAWC